MQKVKTVILCGGKGTRMGNDDLPKVLFPIGGKPILWHIMRIYAHFGLDDFILCLGYKGHTIKEYFSGVKHWHIQFADTGEDTNTGGRLKKIEEFIKEDYFLATYGDGVADINLCKLINFHKKHKKSATITVVKPFSQFGIVGVDPHSQTITHFEEKPVLDHWINGGFFVFDKNIFGYLKVNDILEKDSFGRILKEKGLNAFKHTGFWRCMDTYKDNLELNDLWKKKKALWKIWEE